MTSQPAAERWFFYHGLPAVLTPRARCRGLWPRSAPAFTGYAVMNVALLAINMLTGENDAEILGQLTTFAWIVLLLAAMAVPLAVASGWLVSRLTTARARTVASTAAVAVALVADQLNRGGLGTLSTAAVVIAVLLLTASGIGSVLGWALRLTGAQIAAVGALVSRALPVVLLTVLVFFNHSVWDMASMIGHGRMALVMLVLGLIAATFLVSGTLERARPVLALPTAAPETAARLRGTPFESMDDSPGSDPLTRAERLNVFFVLGASQVVQVLTVAVLTAMLYFILGLIVLSPELRATWTHGGAGDGTLLGITIPVPDALIQVSFFLAALTFMYVSAQAVSDDQYRARFLDPLIDDLQVTLVARDRYRAQGLR
ncbi:MAG: hypothetical protein K0U70_06110 [Actinomycetia bacterium]|nr:hypothetical protein [Actinomycetes bacterium]MCH9767354.1 hypothetical protein [Actinomycetes bacterium]